MSKKYKPTEFSAHLSRSKMRKYLNDTLSQREKQEVELHLKHCLHCSNVIVEYIENEEAEHYKAHMTKLKTTLMSSVKPRKPKFTTGRIKVIRAAAAVVALFIFSFFALGTMVEKDFNLVSDAGKKGNALPALKTSQKQAQKPKANTSPLTEKKTDEIEGQGAANDEVEQDKVEVKESRTSPVVKKKQATVSKPKVTEQKQEEEIKTTAPAKAVEKNVTPSSPAVAEATVEKQENPTKKEVEEEKVNEIENQEVEEDKAKVVESIQPLQKIEKIDAGTQSNGIPEAHNIPTIPNNGVGQLRQK